MAEEHDYDVTITDTAVTATSDTGPSPWSSSVGEAIQKLHSAGWILTATSAGEYDEETKEWTYEVTVSKD